MKSFSKPTPEEWDPKLRDTVILVAKMMGCVFPPYVTEKDIIEWRTLSKEKSAQNRIPETDSEEMRESKALFAEIMATAWCPSARRENGRNVHDDDDFYYDEVIIDEPRSVKEGLACHGPIRPAAFTPSQNKRFTWKNRRRDDRD